MTAMDNAKLTVASGSYQETLENFRPEAEELLAKYVGLKRDEMLPHIYRIRDKAWKKAPYGCVGHFSFTYPSIQDHHRYAKVLSRVKNGGTILDLGCGFGQNTRKLVLDGAPEGNIHGADIERALIDCGYEYFKDEARLSSKFIIGDALDATSDAYMRAKESFDIIFASMFYQLWDWEGQIGALIETVKLLKPVPGSILFGWQLRAEPAGVVQRATDDQQARSTKYKSLLMHDDGSFRRMWREVEQKTGTWWELEVKSIRRPEMQTKYPGVVPQGSMSTAIYFSMTRLGTARL